MNKVMQFKRVLLVTDIALNIIIGIAILFSITTFFNSGSGIAITVIVCAVVFWVLKVLSFGISFTLIQIAENTSTQQKSKRDSTREFTMPENLNFSAQEPIETQEQQFVRLYIDKSKIHSIDPNIEETYNRYQNGERVPQFILSNSITQLKAI